MVILDSDIIIGYLRKSPQAVKVMNNLIKSDSDLQTTLLNVAELYVGVYYSPNVAKSERVLKDLLKHFTILDFTLDDAKMYGQITSELKKKGDLIGDIDELIASIVINHNETLLTKNLDHYNKISRLSIKDWSKL